MLRIKTPLSDELEDVIHRTIGCCIEVHKALGPGLPERAYAKAVCFELSTRGISFETEKRYSVFYRGHLMCEKRVDLVFVFSCFRVFVVLVFSWFRAFVACLSGW